MWYSSYIVTIDLLNESESPSSGVFVSLKAPQVILITSPAWEWMLRRKERRVNPTLKECGGRGRPVLELTGPTLGPSCNREAGRGTCVRGIWERFHSRDGPQKMEEDFLHLKSRGARAKATAESNEWQTGGHIQTTRISSWWWWWVSESSKSWWCYLSAPMLSTPEAEN